jgi:hypothetical protein
LLGDVADVCRELRYEVEFVKLPGAALVRLLVETVSQRLVVGEVHEVPCFQYVSKVLHSPIDGKQFSIVRTVLLLRRVHFLRNEYERLPGVLSTLL